MNLRGRVEKIEGGSFFASRLTQYDGDTRLSCGPYDGDCPTCKAHCYAMMACADWERERGLYVAPAPEDVMMMECPCCGREYAEDGRGYTMEERAAIRQYVLKESSLSMIELNRIFTDRFTKLWGAQGAKMFQERNAVYYSARDEITRQGVR